MAGQGGVRDQRLSAEDGGAGAARGGGEEPGEGGAAAGRAQGQGPQWLLCQYAQDEDGRVRG